MGRVMPQAELTSMSQAATLDVWLGTRARCNGAQHAPWVLIIPARRRCDAARGCMDFTAPMAARHRRPLFPSAPHLSRAIQIDPRHDRPPAPSAIPRHSPAYPHLPMHIPGASPRHPNVTSRALTRLARSCRRLVVRPRSANSSRAPDSRRCVFVAASGAPLAHVNDPCYVRAGHEAHNRVRSAEDGREQGKRNG
jgi:hypothetical protein